MKFLVVILLGGFAIGFHVSEWVGSAGWICGIAGVIVALGIMPIIVAIRKVE